MPAAEFDWAWARQAGSDRQDEFDGSDEMKQAERTVKEGLK